MASFVTRNTRKGPLQLWIEEQEREHSTISKVVAIALSALAAGFLIYGFTSDIW